MASNDSVPHEEEIEKEYLEKPSSLDDEPKSPEDEVDLTRTKVSSDTIKMPCAYSLTPRKSLDSQVSLPREILVVVLISLAQLTLQAGLGSVLSITHIIGNHFNITNPGVLSWLTAGYSLTVGTFILFSGRLGDLFGWKRMMIIGYVWFALWSMVLGLSWYSNQVLFIFARVLQGIGPSICMPNGLALLGALYQPGTRKNLAFAFFGGLAPAGGIIGFVFADLFALAWWPWFFWFSCIALACVAAAAAFVIPDPQTEKPGIRGLSLMDAIARLDLLGAVVGVTALVLFNFAWNQAPIAGWGSPYIIVTLILGILLMPLFFYIEIKVARNPLLPFDVFTTDNAFVLGCITCGWANFGIWFYYLVEILQEIRGASPLLVTAYFAGIPVSGMLAAVTSGFLLAKLGPPTVMIFAMMAFLTGTILVATLPPYQIYWAQIFVTSIIAPWGMDMSFPSATIVVSDSVDKAHQGVAASLVTTIVNYSISLGLGFAGTVTVHINNGGHTKGELLHGFRGGLYLGVGLTGLGLLLAIVFRLKCFMRDRQKKKNADRGSDIENQEK